MNVARALEAECPKCGPLRIMLPVGQEPEGKYLRCPFCRQRMLEWHAVQGTAHTTHPLPYAERMGWTQTGPRPEKIEMPNRGPEAGDLN